MQPPANPDDASSTAVACSTCGHANPRGNRFCIHCGTPLLVAASGAASQPKAVACPKCGAPNAPAYRYCIQCGERLPSEAGPLAGMQKLCAGCHAINETTFSYCYRCGLSLPDRLYARDEIGGSPAGFWRRVIAHVIDDALTATVALLLALAFFGGDVDFTAREDEVSGVFLLALLGTAATYYTATTAAWGQTAGKVLLGIKVLRLDGRDVGVARSFLRYCAYFLSLAPLALGFLSIPLSAQRRGWHDFATGTKVVSLQE